MTISVVSDSQTLAILFLLKNFHPVYFYFLFLIASIAQKEPERGTSLTSLPYL